MDTVLVEALKQSPSSAMVLLCVWYFVTHLRTERAERDKREADREADAAKREQDRYAAIKSMSDACHASHRQVADQHAATSKELAVTLGRAIEVIDRFERRSEAALPSGHLS